MSIDLADRNIIGLSFYHDSQNSTLLAVLQVTLRCLLIQTIQWYIRSLNVVLNGQRKRSRPTAASAFKLVFCYSLISLLRSINDFDFSIKYHIADTNASLASAMCTHRGVYTPKTLTHRRRDETVLSRRRRQCEHNSQLADDDCRRIRSTILKLTKQTP